MRFGFTAAPGKWLIKYKDGFGIVDFGEVQRVSISDMTGTIDYDIPAALKLEPLVNSRRLWVERMDD